MIMEGPPDDVSSKLVGGGSLADIIFRTRSGHSREDGPRYQVARGLCAMRRSASGDKRCCWIVQQVRQDSPGPRAGSGLGRYLYRKEDKILKKRKKGRNISPFVINREDNLLVGIILDDWRSSRHALC